MNIPWVLTDSDTNQYGRKRSDLGKWVFEFKEDNKEETIIDLEDYTTKQLQDYITSYGYSLNPASSFFIFDLYLNKETVNWIIAECIFEQEN